MPDHYHLLVKINHSSFFIKFINNFENSFSRSFNEKFKRKGPLWQSAFKSVRVASQEQFLHISRYIHLNPTSSNLIKNPQDWQFSSYKDFITNQKILDNIKELTINNCLDYQKFVEDRIDYQRKLKLLRKLTIENF